MQSTGQTSMQASQPVQLSALTTASSLGSFFRVLPAPLAMVFPHFFFRCRVRSGSRARNYSFLYFRSWPENPNAPYYYDLNASNVDSQFHFHHSGFFWKRPVSRMPVSGPVSGAKTGSGITGLVESKRNQRMVATK